MYASQKQNFVPLDTSSLTCLANKTTEIFQHIEPTHIMKPSSIPVNYIDCTSRFQIEKGVGKVGVYVLGEEPLDYEINGKKENEEDDNQLLYTSSEKTVGLDKYRVELYCDTESHALRSRYSASKKDAELLKANSINNKSNNRLKSGNIISDKSEIGYYPNRANWLKEWQISRSYALPHPQLHDNYCGYLTSKESDDWKEKERIIADRQRIHFKA